MTVDGVLQTVSGNSYTFENVTEDHTIHVAFELIPSSGTVPFPDLIPSPSSTETDGTVTVSLHTGTTLTSTKAGALLNSAKDAESKNKKAVLEIKPNLSDFEQLVQVTLPRTQFDAIARETSADLHISTNFAEITFDSQALDSISGSASSGDVRISVRPVSPGSLPGDLRSKVGKRFEPEKTITRQEMFKLLYGTLKAIDKLPQRSTSKSLSDFSDAGQIAPWAKESMEYLVEVGVVSGSDGKLNPNCTATRAEMAQILYNLLDK